MVELSDKHRQPEELISCYFNNIREEIISQASLFLTKKLKDANLDRYNEIALNRDVLASHLLLAEKQCEQNCNQELVDCRIDAFESESTEHFKDKFQRAIFANKQLIYANIKCKNDRQGLGVLIKLNEYISSSGVLVLKGELKKFQPLSSLEENVTQIFRDKDDKKMQETPLTLELLKVWFILKRLYELVLDPYFNRFFVTIDFNDFYNLRDITLYFKNLGYIVENAFNANYIRPAKIKMISLYSNKIHSINSQAFNNLHCLEVLNLDFNLLERIDPEWFKPLFNLKELYLSENKLQRVASKCFKELKNLEILSLFGSSNSFDCEVDMFYGLENLKELKLSGIKNIKSDVFEKLANLKKLHLDIRQAPIDDAIFSNLLNIEDFLLQNNPIGCVKTSFLSQQFKLKNLNLQDCVINKIQPNAFTHLKQLEKVSLVGAGLNQIDKNTFKGLDNLKKLDLSYNDFPEGHIFELDGVDESIIHNF